VTWQLRDPNVHDADEWLDFQDAATAEDTVRAYLIDLDPRDYDTGRPFDLIVRDAPGAEQTMKITIQPCVFRINGRLW